MEQLELFDEYEQTPILVRMVVSYTNREYPGVPFLASHQFVDVAPHFQISEALFQQYEGLENAEIDVWHEDVPEGAEISPTHYGDGRIH